MAVSAKEAVAHLERRLAREAGEDSLAAERARACLPALAQVLRARGASRVILFGSLAEGRFRKLSDIDIAVEGLPDQAIFGLMSELTLIAGRQVDLVPIELASKSLVERILEAGEAIP